MAWQRVVLEIGMGTDIRGGDSTKAAVRALKDALWHNSLSIGPVLGQDTDDMRVQITIGVPNPETVNTDEVAAVLPHGTGTVKVVEGGLSMPNYANNDVTIMAHAAAEVFFDLEVSA